jgi:hypothetical protein
MGMRDEDAGMLTLAGSVFGTLLVLFFGGVVVFIAISSRSGTATRQTPPNNSRVLYGTTLINDGYEYYPDWCSMMLREFGDVAKAQLKSDFDLAESIAPQPRDQWESLISQSLNSE